MSSTVDSLRRYLKSWNWDTKVEEILNHLENLDGRTPLDEVLGTEDDV